MKSKALRVVLIVLPVLLLTAALFGYIKYDKIQTLMLEKKLEKATGYKATCWFSDDKGIRVYYTLQGQHGKELTDSAVACTDKTVSVINDSSFFSGKKYEVAFTNTDSPQYSYTTFEFSNGITRVFEDDVSEESVPASVAPCCLAVWYNIEDFDLRTMDGIKYLKILEQSQLDDHMDGKEYESFDFLRYFPDLEKMVFVRSYSYLDPPEKKHSRYDEYLSEISKHLPEDCELEVFDCYRTEKDIKISA